MHRLKAGWLSVAVLVGTGVPAWAADAAPPTAAAQAENPVPWYKRIFGVKPKPKPEAARGVAPARPVLRRPLSPEVQQEAVDAEIRAWQRRMEVCNELRRVAIDKNDEALLREIDELERQAIILYNQRTAALGVKKAKAPAAEIDRRLGTGSAVSPLTVPPSSDPLRTAQNRGTPR